MSADLWIESVAVGGPVSPSGEAMTVLSGWLGVFPAPVGSQRRMVDVLLPGDVSTAQGVLGPIELIALSRAQVQHDRTPDAGSRLAAQRAQESRYQAHILRLGSLAARDRLAHLLLDFHDRLTPVNLATAQGFRLPMTQDRIGEFLGITVVHLNRSLQVLRKAGLVTIAAGRVGLPDPDGLRRMLGAAAAPRRK